MKTPLFKILVLVFSISVVTGYVWYASKNQTPPAPEPATPAEAVDEQAPPKRVVTEEEVRVTKELLFSTSKSGVVMSDEDIRKMLEDGVPLFIKPVEYPSLIPADLMPSSKSIDAILSPGVLREIIEPTEESVREDE